MKTKKSAADYFDKFLTKTPMALALWRSGEAAVLNEMVPRWPQPVLDLGCGFGEFMGVFFDGTIEVGVDINQKDLIMASHQKKYQQLTLADARKLPFPDASMRTVVSVSVLEHIPDVDQVFSEVYRVLQPGGLFIYSVPTKMINAKLKGAQWFSKTYTQLYHRIYKHVNIWPHQHWLTLTQQTGFQHITWQPTLSESQLHLFELGTLLAIPSQVTRIIRGDRWVVDFQARHALWKKLIYPYIVNTPKHPLNIAVVGIKP